MTQHQHQPETPTYMKDMTMTHPQHGTRTPQSPRKQRLSAGLLSLTSTLRTALGRVGNGDQSRGGADQVTWEEAQLVHHASGSAALLECASSDGRFEVLIDVDGVTADDDLTTSTVTAGLLGANPTFTAGTLMWSDTYLEALFVMKAHRAHGYVAVLLNDMAAEPGCGSYAVLSTYPWPLAA